MSLTQAELSDLYMRYAPILHHRARNILGTNEDAHDAVQETFARVLRNHEGFRQAASPLTWMYQINTNWCLNKLRDRKGHAKKQVDHRREFVAKEATDAEEGGVDVAVIRTLLADADDEERRVVIHLFFDDMTREEAAAMVGISLPTLRKRLDHFLTRARKQLGVSVVVSGIIVLFSWWVQS